MEGPAVCGPSIVSGKAAGSAPAGGTRRVVYHERRPLSPSVSLDAGWAVRRERPPRSREQWSAICRLGRTDGRGVVSAQYPCPQPTGINDWDQIMSVANTCNNEFDRCHFREIDSIHHHLFGRSAKSSPLDRSECPYAASDEPVKSSALRMLARACFGKETRNKLLLFPFTTRHRRYFVQRRGSETTLLRRFTGRRSATAAACCRRSPRSRP